jgi:hypothetical protein
MGRLKEFEAVHSGESPDDKIDALDIFTESLGIDDVVKYDLLQWAMKLEGCEGCEGPFILGVIVGAVAARYEVEGI